MKICKRPNFKKDEYSSNVNLRKIQGSTIDELVQSIYDSLEGINVPFSISYSESLDPDNYEDGISQLLDVIKDKLNKVIEKTDNDFIKNLTPANKGLITKGLKEKLMPAPLTPVEIYIQNAVIPDADLVTLEDLQKIKYKGFLNFIYEGTNRAYDTWRTHNFEEDLYAVTILDTKKGKIVNGNFDLNNNIIEYQQQQYKVIYDYLNNYVFNGKMPSDLFPKNYYTAKYNDTTVRIPTKNNRNLFLAMYNHIKALKNQDKFSKMIDDGYNESFNDEVHSQSKDLFNAVAAYTNLRFFDATIKNSVGKFINIDGSKVIPIDSIESEFGDITRTYKYTIAVGNNNAIKTWGANENADAVKMMSDFNKFIINRIPIYDFSTKKQEFGHLEVKDFLASFLKLKELGPLYKSTTSNFAKYCEDINSGIDNLKSVFKILFGKKENQSLLNSLLNLGFNQNDFNVLYSVYQTVFNGKSSWDNIERNFALTTGLRSRYNLVENLYGLICSNEALNYLQTQYNYETNKYETTIKEKYSINRYKFSLKETANRINYLREDKATLLKQYSYNESNDKLNYSFKIDGITYNVKVINNEVNILSKKHPVSNYEITVKIKGKQVPLKEFFFGENPIEKFDTYTSEGREKLVNDSDSKFKQLLSFIDNILDTTFSVSPESLLELNYGLKNQNDFLESLVVSATRGLVVNNIYNKLANSKDKNDKPFSKIKVKDFMKEVGGYEGIHDAEDQNEFFDKSNVGYYLNIVHPNETWLNTLAKGHAIINQDTSSSVTTDAVNNHIPNTSPAYLSATASIKEQMKVTSENGGASGYLLFSNNRNAIEVATVNLDVQTDEYKAKSLKDLTEGELFQDAIINKFLYPLVENGHIYTQCTTQSDKTKFIANKVNLKNINFGKDSLFNLCKKSTLEKEVIKSLQDTIGEAYKSIYNQVINDYKILFPNINDIDQINDLLKGSPVKIFDNSVVSIKNEKDLISVVNKYNKVNKTPITLYKDLHYRQINNGLAFNELLDEFATNLYANPDRLKSRLQLEKVRFLNALTSRMFSLEVTDQLRVAMNKMGVKIDEWTTTIEGPKDKEYHTYLVLAKSKNGNILFGKTDESEQIKLNPILDTYFLVDNLIGNNIRFATTGSEINHKISALPKLNLRDKLVKAFDNESIVNTYFGNTVTFHDLKNAIQNETIPVEIRNIFSSIYDQQIYKMENLGENAQFKRNVIMSATMTKFTPSINGISKNMNIACIYDIQANVFNFTGDNRSIDAHDGSAQVSPLWSILENKSLGSNEVGTVKKPIHHFYNDKYMTATLLKYATDAITNNWMRQSIGNNLNNDKHAIDLYKIFKKMHNKRWTDSEGNWIYGEIDLVNGCGFREGGKINFKKDILEGQELFYNKQGIHYKILDFGKDSINNVYYTLEEHYDDGHSSSGVQTKVYHYYDSKGNHIPSNKILNNPEYHTIDSLFELHNALGGIWTESWNGSNFVYSESSNIATVNFINNVCTLNKEQEKEFRKNNKTDPIPIEAKYYDQPLKGAMIHMIANNSAVKNGVGNINPSTSWVDDSELSFMTISTKHYGIQQDSDHTADMAHMTEFSQVISSLDAGGYLHDYVSQIYEQLGATALDLSQVELEAIKEFRSSKNKSKLYDLIGRTIIAQLKNENSSSSSLAGAIISKIKKKFNLNSDHKLDNLKIPFSDPNIFSQILSSFVSNINKKSIKRQYPGLGTVMVPSYNMSMIYDFGEYPMQFEDVLKEAQKAGFKSDNTDNTIAIQEIVKQYLQKKQKEIPKQEHTAFIPTDNVLVVVNKDENHAVHLSLNSITDYYKFQASPGMLVAEKLYNTNFKKTTLKGKLNSRSRKIIELPNECYKITLGSNEYYLIKDLQKDQWVIDLKGDALSKTDRERLLKSAALAIPEGHKLSTYSDFGQDENLGDLGFTLLNDDTFIDPSGKIRKTRVWNQTNTFEFYKDVTVPRNLAPARIEFDYEDPNTKEVIHSNIFNSYIIKKRILELDAVNSDESLNSSQKKLKIKEIERKYDSEKVFRDLKEGKFQLEDGTIANVIKGSLSNKAAEIIMSNLYASKFGIKDGNSLYDVLKQGSDYFKVPEVILDSTNYDLVFTKNSGDHTFITFKPLAKNTDDNSTEYVEWENTNPVTNESVENLADDSPKVINRVYAITKDNVKLLEVGREIINNDVIWDGKQKVFTDLKGKKVLDQNKYRRYGDKVLEYVEFITKHIVTEKTPNNGYIKYELYNINRSAIARALEYRNYFDKELTDKDGKKHTIKEKRNIEINKFISGLLADLYQTDSYSGVSMNNKLTPQTVKVLNNTLKGFAKKIDYDEVLSKYVSELPSLFSKYKVKEDGTEECAKVFLKKAYKTYQQKIKDRIFTSFKRSLDFTVARIPAQTLQSFMKMRNVGFSGTKTGQCYVTAWQTYLQGSDYDIDKAYVMGLSFDDNGKYLGWSNLFNYDNYLTLEASEKLPMPKHLYLSKIDNVDKALQDYTKQIFEATSDDYKNILEKRRDSLKNVVNIDEYIEQIENAETPQEKIEIYANLLNHLYRNTYNDGIQEAVNITYTNLKGNEVLRNLQKHENTKIPKKQASEISKNFISSHIQHTIQDLNNMTRAYSPIDIEVFRGASEFSDKGSESNELTLLNPTCKMIMQYQNMVGKNVIGIAANGEKASFMWHYYLNDIIRYGNDKDLEYAQFSFTTNRIVGRAGNKLGLAEIQNNHVVNGLPDMNFETLSPERKEKMENLFNQRITGNLYVDLMISQVLSAATD